MSELEAETHADADNAIEIKEEEPASESQAVDGCIASDKSSERIYFLKRFVDNHPRLDILLEIGGGRLQLDKDKAELAIWEASDDIYIYRKAGRDIKCPRLKKNFAKKTCGFIATRDSGGQLRVVKMAISGTSFHPRRDEDKYDFLHQTKWATRVKHFAKKMNINLRTIYDGSGRNAKAEDIGNWRAGHVEKKLSTHIVWTFLAMYGILGKSRKVSLRDLRQLRLRLRQKGWRPHFELHLSRAPCGTPQRSGQCVPFVKKLTQLTGIRFTIHSWEENVILDGSVPSKPEPRRVEKTGLQDQVESPGGYDSEAVDLDAFLDENEAETNIVFDGFEEARMSRGAREFKNSLRRFKRQADEIEKPYPPTPVTEQHHFWEDRRTPLSSRRQSAASADKRDRRAHKHEVRRRRAIMLANEAAQNSSGTSALAGRLGGLLNSTRLLR
ncbi:hypothetical protein LX36DRAFT_679162 [Colletotrichum falcatum]|nr:hypothetical protein LX36DRAFT_679162 [Colletotrichum falcatum]